MDFYLGTHIPNWLSDSTVKTFVSARQLRRRRTLPIAVYPWALDSGGFSELSLFGEWRTSEAQYIQEVRRYADEIGLLEWAAPQDWMCEPFILKRTGLSVVEHQRRTITNYLSLKDAAPDLPFIPVLQGWTRGDYLRHIEAYSRTGVDLFSSERVGLGTVCRRQRLTTASRFIVELADMGLNLHGFGIKLNGVHRFGSHLKSADSLAWSFDARYGKPLPNCTHKRCTNCRVYALLWRQKLLSEKCLTKASP